MSGLYNPLYIANNQGLGHCQIVAFLLVGFAGDGIMNHKTIRGKGTMCIDASCNMV